MEITTQARDEYLDNVIRALGSGDAGVSDYTILDYNEVIVLAATMNTPLSARLARKATAKATTHYWLDQSLAAGADNAQSETADPAENAADKPTRYSNTLQIQAKKVAVTDTMQRIARAGGLHGHIRDELGRQVDMKMKELLRDQERALTNGVESTVDPRAMKGIKNWIPAGTTHDIAAAQVTATNVEGFLNAMIQKVVDAEGGAIPNALYVPAAFLGPLRDSANSRVQVTVSLSELRQRNVAKFVAGSAIGYFLSDFGLLEIVFTPLLTAATSSAAAATSNVLALYEDAITITDMVGSGIEVQDRAKSAPTETKVITQELTLEVRMLTSHAKLTNWYI